MARAELPAVPASSASLHKSDITRVIAYAQQNGQISATPASISMSSGATKTSLEKAIAYAAQNRAVSGTGVVSQSSRAVNSRIFSAHILEADWSTASNAFTCSLTQNIPNFGKAVFTRKTGSDEVFYLESQVDNTFPEGMVSIDMVPPLWRSDLQSLKLGRAVAIAGNKPVSLKADDLTMLLSPLNDGKKIMLTSVPIVDAVHAQSSSENVIRLALEPKKFTEAYKRYQQCLTALIPYTFNQVSRFTFFYPEKSEHLTDATIVALSKMARYMKADNQVLGVLIDAHSDNAFSADINEATTKQQAEWVRDYLIEKGVATEKIKLRWHADKFPIANNKTAEGRAKNRRVTVRMETDETRKRAEANLQDAKIASERAVEEHMTVKSSLANTSEVDKKNMVLTKKSPANDAINAAKISSDQGKVTSEDVHKMVEGLDFIKK